jgi:DNA-binding Lrp family transcriptional regulator
MKEEIFLDTYSLRLLAELQRDARQTVQQLAQRVGLSATPCWKRIKDMEAAGVIRGYSVLVDREKLGLRQLAVVEVNLERHTETLVQQFERAVAATPQIVRCLSTTGQADYILTVLVRDIQHYEQLLHSTLFRLPGVAHMRTNIVLKEVKFDMRLPVEALPLAAAAPRSGSAEPEASG